MRFEDKVAAITSAGQGSGAGLTKAFAKEGAVVVLIGRTGGKLQAVAEEIGKEGGRALAKACSIAVLEQVEQCFREIEQEAGNVDVFVSNAAYHKLVPVVEASNEEWLSQISINLNGTFFCTRAILPAVIRNRYGKIINISSSATKHFFSGFGVYAASKGGIVNFTHTLSEEAKQYGTNVSAIYLGMTNTEHAGEWMDSDQTATIDLDSMLQMEDIAEVVTFLASDAAAPIMGAAIDVFGKKSQAG